MLKMSYLLLVLSLPLSLSAQTVINSIYDYNMGDTEVVDSNNCINTSNTISVSACESYTSPSGNYIWISSDTYLDTIPNTAGCDSVITIILTIVNIDISVTLSTTMIANHSGTSASYQWVDCNSGNIAGETSQSFSPPPTLMGDYAVIITEYGCQDTSICNHWMSVDNLEPNSNWSFYPNPTTGKITLDFNAMVISPSVEIFNSLGQSLSKQYYTAISTIELNLEYAAGVYWIRVQNESGNSVVFKIFKQ